MSRFFFFLATIVVLFPVTSANAGYCIDRSKRQAVTCTTSDTYGPQIFKAAQRVMKACNSVTADSNAPKVCAVDIDDVMKGSYNRSARTWLGTLQKTLKKVQDYKKRKAKAAKKKAQPKAKKAWGEACVYNTDCAGDKPICQNWRCACRNLAFKNDEGKYECLDSCRVGTYKLKKRCYQRCPKGYQGSDASGKCVPKKVRKKCPRGKERKGGRCVCKAEHYPFGGRCYVSIPHASVNSDDKLVCNKGYRRSGYRCKKKRKSCPLGQKYYSSLKQCAPRCQPGYYMSRSKRTCVCSGWNCNKTQDTPKKTVTPPQPRAVVKAKVKVPAGCATKISSLQTKVTALQAQVQKLKNDNVAQQTAHKAELAKVVKKESSKENTGRALGLTLGLYGATFSGQAAKGLFGVSAGFISELTRGGKVPLFFSAEGGFTFSAAVNAQKDEGHAWFIATGMVIGNIPLSSSMATLHGQVGYLYHNDGISQKGKLVHGDLGGVYAGGKLFLKSRLVGKMALAFDLKGFVAQHTLKGKSETVFGVMAGFSLTIIP